MTTPPDGGSTWCGDHADSLAAAVLDRQGDIRAWSQGAAQLVGYSASEAHGRSALFLLGDGDARRLPALRKDCVLDSVLLRRRNGSPVPVRLELISLTGDTSGCLAVAMPVEDLQQHEQNESLLRCLAAQDWPQLCVLGPDLRIQRASVTLGDVRGKRLHDVYVADDAEALEDCLAHVRDTGEPTVGWTHRMRPVGHPRTEPVLRFTILRLLGHDGTTAGLATVARDVTAEHRSRQHLALLRKATATVGDALNPRRTAETLANSFVPDFASWAAVDLVTAVFEGSPLPVTAGPWPTHQRQAAVAYAGGEPPLDLGSRAAALNATPDTERTRALRQGRAVLTTDLTALSEGDSTEARFLRAIYPESARSVIIAPLHDPNGLLGVLSIGRGADAAPFDQSDVLLVEEITTRLALSLDNAWRYAQEHRRAVALQKSLLPRSFTDGPAAETAGSYLSAGVGSGVGGDWFDAIPLSSLRTAFVVGDVVGHGLRATAAMGRLATAVQTLADLDLDPSELLARMDDLVVRLSSDRYEDPRAADEEQYAAAPGALGATCLYAVYDPVSRRCALASAGHPPPALLPPGEGEPRLLEIEPGPPLGIGGMPFETMEFELPPGSLLAFYTDGLVRGGDLEMGPGTDKLLSLIGSSHRPHADLQGLGQEIFSALARPQCHDDAALLLARTRSVPAGNTLFRQLAAEDSVVPEARALAARQLSAWGLDELGFAAEIVVSELVTNAIRYAGGPIGLRLIHDSVLVCEVTDPSNTQPRLRMARSTDEGGRGLFLVAQLSQRWGSRYGRTGKTIWAELPLPKKG